MGLEHGVPDRVAEYRAYYGGLQIRTTIDLPMQRAAEQAIAAELPSGPGEPKASLVAIDNRTGEVRAMVGGPLVNGQEDYAQLPVQPRHPGHRQPGSAFKPFTLAVALQSGYGPDSVIDSKPLNLIVPHSGGKEHFLVHNFGNVYSGPITLAAGHRESGQQRLHPGRHRRRHQTDRAHGQGDGHPLAGVKQLRDDPRRSEGGRLPARSGPRLRDDRRGRPARVQPAAR